MAAGLKNPESHGYLRSDLSHNYGAEYGLHARDGVIYKSALIGLLLSLVAMADSNITWTNFGFYAESAGNGVEKVSTPTDWTSGPHSIEMIELGDFFLEFPITEVDTNRHIGFGPNPSVSDHFSAMDFSIRLEPNGGTAKAIGYRGGTQFLTLVETGDTLRIQVIDGTISIYHNDVHLAGKDYPNVTVNYPTFVDTSLYSVGATFQDVTFGPHAGDAPAFLSVELVREFWTTPLSEAMLP